MKTDTLYQDTIRIRGAREHNLKNIHVTIPRNRLVVVTGPSGSGKSSLAFDTIYAEGQRRYVESLSTYARQFMEQLKKPDVHSIEGLSPSIAIDQKTTSRNPRSTLGTITEIHDYLRVLYTRVGRPHCPECLKPITSQSLEQLHEQALSLPPGTRVQVLAPIVRGKKGEHRKELDRVRRDGFIRARIDGMMTDLSAQLVLDKRKLHTVEVVIDRLVVKNGIARRLTDAVDQALRYSDLVQLNLVDEDRDLLYSRAMACPECGFSYPEISPRLFSFNSPYGACSSCRGLGLESPVEAEPDEEAGPAVSCKACGGSRLRREALSVFISDRSIHDLSLLTVAEARDFFLALELPPREERISRRVTREIRDRLSFLVQVGLSYLTLNRPARSLSGGEGQRIRLATQMGSSLTGVLYILDEPSIGLHPRDCGRLLDTLEALRNNENSVIVVEHDEETIRRADYIIDMGPGAGIHGGFVVCEGPPKAIEQNERSLTGRYLRAERKIPVPPQRRQPTGFIEILGAKANNLKNVDAQFPLGVLTCVTGVSGSGKSTLVFDVLHQTLTAALSSSGRSRSSFRRARGLDRIKRVIHVDQRPLGRSPRSNAATYTGILSQIRTLFAHLPESRVRGYGPGRFSFNVRGGRCEECGGDGERKIEMHYLPPVYIPCETCEGRRYNQDTLDVRYKGMNIAEVLDMTVTEALVFFEQYPALRRKLSLLEDVGLGYVRLGQPAPSLSGGEAQRVKIATELGKKVLDQSFYILDEPTTGLHFQDVARLMKVLDSLVSTGATVVVIEHNLEVIKCADHIIDLGPEGGEAGGYVVATGPPEAVAGAHGSHTGRFLRKVLGL